MVVIKIAITEYYDEVLSSNIVSGVEAKAGNVTIAFNKAAIDAIAAGNNVSLQVVVGEEEGYEMVLNITLANATFADGKATVSVPYATEVPAGKVVKVYFVDADGNKTDMGATLLQVRCCS